MANMPIESPLYTWLKESTDRLRKEGRPIVTLSYAQSLDGSIALRRGSPLAMSGPESMRMTHRLRAAHDAILVGIGTIQADDPQLTVRVAEGKSPTPVILDSHLKAQATAKVFQHLEKPILACLEAEAKSGKATSLTRAGGVILPVKDDGEGHVSLPDLLNALDQRGIHFVMVEGGAKVIHEFLRQCLVDRVVLTIVPVFVGGLKAVENPVDLQGNDRLRLKNAGVEPAGNDFVAFGELDK